MDRTERIYKIKAMLLDGRPVRMDRLLAALEVSRPTVRRDLDYMRDRLNWPIIWDRDRGGCRVDDSAAARYELPGLWLSSAETHALLTMHYLLARLQPRLRRIEPALRSGCERQRGNMERSESVHHVVIHCWG